MNFCIIPLESRNSPRAKFCNNWLEELAKGADTN